MTQKATIEVPRLQEAFQRGADEGTGGGGEELVVTLSFEGQVLNQKVWPYDHASFSEALAEVLKHLQSAFGATAILERRKYTGPPLVAAGNDDDVVDAEVVEE